MDKQTFITLATAYIEAYKRDVKLYQVGQETGVYIDIENDVCVNAIEEVFNRVNPYLVEDLLDLATQGYVTMYDVSNDKDETIEVKTVEEFYRIYYLKGVL